MTRTLTIVLTASLAGSVHGQSLADAAKKAEEKRAAAAGQTSTTRVYTKEDVDAVPRDVMLTASRAPATPPPSAAAPSESAPVDTAGPAKDEAYWKRRMAPLRAQVEDNRRSLAAARTDLQNVESHMLMPSLWGALAYDWGRAKDNVAMLEGIVRDAEKRVSDLEEEARVAGVLPGWLR